MTMNKKAEAPTTAYFAPPSAEDAAVPDTQAPVWGEDAERIARTAGLGGYGASNEEHVKREDALIAALEVDLRTLYARTRALSVVVILLAVVDMLLVVAAWLRP